MDWYITMIFVEANVIEKGYGGGGLGFGKGKFFKLVPGPRYLVGNMT